MPPLRLLPLLLLLAAAAAALDPPTPTPWPEQFHAVVFTNLTGSGGRLQLIDLYYDWPRGRNLNLIRGQLSGDPTYDVEWTNGTSYFFNATSCRTKLFPVGLLPPDWLAAGAVYLGRETVAGFDCHLWTKVDFVWYYEDVVTHRPVRWNFFNGMQQHVMSFEVGGVLEDSKWQAPARCFSDQHTVIADPGAATVTDDRVEGEDGKLDVMNAFFSNMKMLCANMTENVKFGSSSDCKANPETFDLQRM
ncbi:hypothetical protein OsI_25194 [Oryza sativa Indica Group]|uniref:Uncharacterized protein n=1 Tax=Oryza sativa subsp. indica TaxID=39946 RepID=A2YIZ1_ORYSI|nr:hypothetical protein OsI_25194 [Oryza sativa Indica Group]